jgi:hypothetical protein
MRREWLPVWLSGISDRSADLGAATVALAAYEIKQGTIEQAEADTEWALRPYVVARGASGLVQDCTLTLHNCCRYQRTARKRNQL